MHLDTDFLHVSCLYIDNAALYGVCTNTCKALKLSVRNTCLVCNI